MHIPSVSLATPGGKHLTVTAFYMGFTDEGSFIEDPTVGTVYLWKYSGGQHGTLKLLYKSDREIPHAVLQQLASSVEGYSAVDYLLEGDASVASSEPLSTPGADPNLKCCHYVGSAIDDIAVHWDYLPGLSTPEVYLPVTVNPDTHPSDYLGFTSEGSFIRNPFNARVYVWKYRPGASEGRLAVRYANVLDIPLATLEQLDRSLGENSQVKGLIARKSPTQEKPPAQPTSPPANTGGGAMGATVRAAVAGNNGLGLPNGGASPPQPAVAGDTVRGINASVKDGVLSYTDAGGKRISMKVEPPPGATSAGSTGTWLAYNVEGRSGDDRQAVVMGDGTVTVSPLDPKLRQMLQMLRQMQGAKPQ